MVDMKTLTTIFTTISVLTWWHVPIVAMLFSLINIIILLLKSSYETHYMVMLVINIMAIGLSLWNWDLRIGMGIIEKYMEIRRARY